MSDLGNKEIFAKNLKHYMDLNNKDRNTVCEILDIPYTTLSDWLNAKKYPRIDKIEMLANYFKIEKSDLIERKEKSKDSENIEALLSAYKDLPDIDKEWVKNMVIERRKLIDNQNDNA